MEVVRRIPEFTYTDDDFRQIKGLIYDDAGIFLPDTFKATFFTHQPCFKSAITSLLKQGNF